MSLDATKEQQNVDCQEELEEIHHDYLHMDTDNVEENNENTQKNQNIYRKIDIPDLKELKKKLVNLTHSSER